jgi:hypothetical protein
MAQQTALDEIILAINEQMDILEMDYNNDVVWSMLVMHNCLKGLLFKCNQAKAMEKEQIIKAFCEGYDHDGDNYDGAEISYYNRTYKGGDK